MTLGELALLLEQAPNKELPVEFDSGKKPCELSSWRGSYAEIAFEYDDSPDAPAPKVREVIAELRKAIGTVYHGYKGGDFLMGKNTPIWISQWGNSENEAPVGVTVQSDKIIITTKELEY